MWVIVGGNTVPIASYYLSIGSRDTLGQRRSCGGDDSGWIKSQGGEMLIKPVQNYKE